MKKHVTLFSSVLMMSTTLLGAGGVFAAEQAVPNPADTKTPVTAELTVDDSVTPELPEGSTEEDHTNNNTTGALGIAYQPKSFSGTKQLKATGEDEVSLSSNSAESYHVGVKDLTRQKHEWTLKAKLSWNNDESGYMNGTSIKLEGGNVQKNVSGTLSPLSENEVTGAPTITIDSTGVEVMKSNKEKNINGIYDYGFTSAKLIIPKAENVPADTYAGNIDWNLSVTPTGA